jgi:RNA polymerase sigma-70 factor (ECF subfamily)
MSTNSQPRLAENSGIVVKALLFGRVERLMSVVDPSVVLVPPDEGSVPSQTLEAALAIRNELYRFLVAAAGDRALADDVLQETLVKAQAQRSVIRDPRAWCYVVALNLLRSQLRRYRWLPLIFAEKVQAPEFVEGHALREAVHSALRRLPTEQRTVLVLHVVSGFSCREIAELQGSTESAVKQRLYRARERFRHAYGTEAK